MLGPDGAEGTFEGATEGSEEIGDRCRIISHAVGRDPFLKVAPVGHEEVFSGGVDRRCGNAGSPEGVVFVDDHTRHAFQWQSFFSRDDHLPEHHGGMAGTEDIHAVVGEVLRADGNVQPAGDGKDLRVELFCNPENVQSVV